MDVVPKIQMGNSEGGGLLESLLGVMLSEKLNNMLPAQKVSGDGGHASEASTIRESLREQIEGKSTKD